MPEVRTEKGVNWGTWLGRREALAVLAGHKLRSCRCA
jgi:hypothetical protein